MVVFKIPIKTNGGTFDVEIRTLVKRDCTATEKYELFEGVKGMMVGEKRKLMIPPRLAYVRCSLYHRRGFFRRA